MSENRLDYNETPAESLESEKTRLKMLEYFQKYFSLQLNSSGQILDDKNLQNLLKIVFKMLQREISIKEVLNILNTREIVDMTDNPSCPVTPAEEPSFLLTLPAILDEIRCEFGPHPVNLLYHLVSLSNQLIPFKFCYHIFYGTEIKRGIPKVVRLSNRNGLEDDWTKIDGDGTKIENLQSMLSTLEKYCFINKLENIENPGDDEEDEEEGNFKLNLAIQVSPPVYNFLRNKCQNESHNLENDDENWTTIVLKLSRLLMTSRSPGNDLHVKSLHDALKSLGWPRKSHFYSLHFATVLTLWFKAPGDARDILNDVYKFLMKPSSAARLKREMVEEMERDFCVWSKEEYFTVCKMALVNLENKRRKEDDLTQGKAAEWKFGRSEEEEEMDTCKIFYEDDVLHGISRLKFFDWVLSQAVKFPDNLLVQHLAAQLLVVPLAENEKPLEDERYSQVVYWIRQYCRNLESYRMAGEKQMFNLLETPLTIVKIGMQILASTQVIQMAVEMSRASSCADGIVMRAWFLQDCLYLAKPSPICVWEQEEEVGAAKLFEMREICVVYVEQGVPSFTAMLTEMGKTFGQDCYLDLHLLDFLETMKAVAFFDECVLMLLECTEFLSSFRNILTKILQSIEVNEDRGNIKAAFQILVFWYALLALNLERCNKWNKALALIVEEMEDFYSKLSSTDSKIHRAFNMEKHWHSYFREQGGTNERILAKFLTAARRDDPLAEKSSIYKLAEKLTEKTRKYWWLTSVNYITTATRAFGGKERLNNNNSVENETKIDRWDRW